jgi:hypothetical protein
MDDVQARIQHELTILRENGQQADLILTPRPAVIYRVLPVLGSTSPITTDVLVPVPSGYPGAMIDLAFLPAGSSLIGQVLGQPQNIENFDGRGWQQISYHPHNGGGGPPWDPAVHGFHTYLDELLTWLERRR